MISQLVNPLTLNGEVFVYFVFGITSNAFHLDGHITTQLEQ